MFLTSITQPQKQPPIPLTQAQQIPQLPQLLKRIRSIATKLSHKQIINHVLNNLGLSYDVITTAIKIDQNISLTSKELNRLYSQLRNIQKQFMRIHDQKAGICRSSSLLTSRERSADLVVVSRCKTMKMRRVLDVSKPCKSVEPDCVILKKEVEQELYARKIIEQLKGQQFQARKREFLINIVKKANERNKKSQMVLKKVTQKQRQKQLTQFKKLRSMPYQDFSIWAKKNYQTSSTATSMYCKGNFQNSFHQGTQEQNRYDYIITDKTQKNYQNYQKYSLHEAKQAENTSPTKDKNISPSTSQKDRNIKSISIQIQCQRQHRLQSQKIKLRNALQRRRQQDEYQQKYAIRKVVKKHLAIQNISMKKNNAVETDQINLSNSTSQREQGKIREIRYHSQHHNKSVSSISMAKEQKILDGLQEKNRRKQQLIAAKSDLIKQNILRNRERVLRNKQQQNKQNQLQFQHQTQTMQNLQISRQNKQKKERKQNVRLQELVRDKNKHIQHEKNLRRQIIKLSKKTKQELEKDLLRYEEEISNIKDNIQGGGSVKSIQK